MRTLIQDLRFGCWMLMKSAGFTAAAALTLALGIGATSTIFSWLYSGMARLEAGTDVGFAVGLNCPDKDGKSSDFFTSQYGFRISSFSLTAA